MRRDLAPVRLHSATDGLMVSSYFPKSVSKLAKSADLAKSAPKRPSTTIMVATTQKVPTYFFSLRVVLEDPSHFFGVGDPNK